MRGGVFSRRCELEGSLMAELEDMQREVEVLRHELLALNSGGFSTPIPATGHG